MVKGLAEFLISRGFRVAILSRGYHRLTKGPLIVSDGMRLKTSWQESGDESYLLASTLPEAIVVVAAKRSDGFGLVEPFKPDVILLDDAFQHRKVERDLDVVLIDATENILKQKLIPFGKLREELGSLQRADAVVLTHQKNASIETTEWVRKNIHVPVFSANYVMENPHSIHGMRIAAISAIGAPHHFFRLLQEEGAELVATKSFRDHHPFAAHEIEDFRRQAAEKDAAMIVTTAKDAVKMDPAWFDSFLKPIGVKLQITEEALFFDFVMNELSKSAIRASKLP